MPKKVLRRYLSASDRFSEIMFGLIMAMTTIGAANIALHTGNELLDSRVIISAALGCNIAWGLVDGIMYVFTETFDRGKLMNLVTTIKACRDEEDAIPIIDEGVDSIIIDSLSAEERKRVFSAAYKMMLKTKPIKAHVIKDDIIGAFVCFILVFTTAFLTVIPLFLQVGNLLTKIWISRLISFSILFIAGYRYAEYTNRSRIKTASAMVTMGLLINAIIIALGG